MIEILFNIVNLFLKKTTRRPSKALIEVGAKKA